MVGGTQMHMGRMEAAGLKGMDLKIEFKYVKALDEMLALLNPDDCSVCATERDLILTDGVFSVLCGTI
jgi:hypothetical protein